MFFVFYLLETVASQGEELNVKKKKLTFLY